MNYFPIRNENKRTKVQIETATQSRWKFLPTTTIFPYSHLLPCHSYQDPESARLNMVHFRCCKLDWDKHINSEGIAQRCEDVLSPDDFARIKLYVSMLQ